MTRVLRKTMLAALAALAVLVAAPPAPADAADGMELALQDDPLYLTGRQGNVRRREGLDLAQRLRVTRIRVNIQWASVMPRSQARARRKPRQVRYDFTAFDSLINDARARGIQLQLSLTGPAPAWAAGNRRIGPMRPSPGHFRGFARASAQHFAGVVDRFSIWNEPNLEAWISPMSSAPRIYRSLYAIGYSEIKRVNRNAQVLIGETSPYAIRGRATAPITFLRGVANRGTLRTDGYAHHPYDYQHAPNFRYPGGTNATLGTLNNLVRELNRLASRRRLRTPGGGAPDLFLTEYGYFNSGRHAISETRRGQYLRQAYDIALAHPRVRQMVQFLLVQPSRRYRFFDLSVVNRNGGVGRAFRALESWANDNAGRIASPNSPPPGSGGGGGNNPIGGEAGANNPSGGGAGGAAPPPSGEAPPPSCAPLPVCPP
jgi:hypothetical protein